MKERQERSEREQEPYARIGQLQMELEWIKKVGLAAFSVEQRRHLIEPELDEISILRQCELFDLSRSSYYHEVCSESAENLTWMRLIDEQYLG